MTDETNTPRPAGVIHPPENIQAAAARIRRFLELWDSTEDVVGFTEEFRLNSADLTTVLDALDAGSTLTGFIEFPGSLTEQQYEELKAKWRETHQPGQRRVVVEWRESSTSSSGGVAELVRSWVRKHGGATGA